MKFPKIGSLFEKHIGGLFHRGIRNELTPDDVELALGEELKKSRRKLSRGALLPNSFEVSLCVDDYHRLSSRRFIEEINMFIEREVILSDSFMDGPLDVKLSESFDMTEGECDVSSCFEDEREEDEVDGADGGTLVLARLGYEVPLNLPPARKFVVMRVIDGPDMDKTLEFGERKIYIGRRDKNELVLNDLNASRLHAYVEYERHRHVIYDADSLNGTFVNGELVKSACLSDGDEVRLGSTVIRYEVI